MYLVLFLSSLTANCSLQRINRTPAGHAIIHRYIRCFAVNADRKRYVWLNNLRQSSCMPGDVSRLISKELVVNHWYSMQLSAAGQPLQQIKHDTLPIARAGQVLIRVKACGVCRTDLHIIDGDLTFPTHPVVPGHEVVGIVIDIGAGVTSVKAGDRVGIPWLGWTCGSCEACNSGNENLCENARFTGYQIAGGYAEYAVADARYVFAIPPAYTDADAAPLLCAGLIGYRALAMAQRELTQVCKQTS